MRMKYDKTLCNRHGINVGGLPVGYIGVHVSKLFDIMSSKTRPFLPGYLSSLENVDGKKRYKETLAILDGLDPCETVRSEWLDDIDFWPCVTCVHIAMYSLLTPSSYFGEDLMNYKSIDRYIREKKRRPLTRVSSL